MPSKSKSKGNNFERAVSKVLSEAYKDKYNIDVSFRRSVTSGSMFGGSNSYRANRYLNKSDVSDIITPPDFKYVIECKHYAKAPSLNAFIQQNCKQFDDWIKQVSNDAEIAHKLPMLVVKYDNIKPMMFIKEKLDIQPIMFYKSFIVYNFEEVFKNKEVIKSLCH